MHWNYIYIHCHLPSTEINRICPLCVLLYAYIWRWMYSLHMCRYWISYACCTHLWLDIIHFSGERKMYENKKKCMKNLFFMQVGCELQCDNSHVCSLVYRLLAVTDPSLGDPNLCSKKYVWVFIWAGVITWTGSVCVCVCVCVRVCACACVRLRACVCVCVSFNSPLRR